VKKRKDGAGRGKKDYKDVLKEDRGARRWEAVEKKKIPLPKE